MKIWKVTELSKSHADGRFPFALSVTPEGSGRSHPKLADTIPKWGVLESGDLSKPTVHHQISLFQWSSEISFFQSDRSLSLRHASCHPLTPKGLARCCLHQNMSVLFFWKTKPESTQKSLKMQQEHNPFTPKRMLPFRQHSFFQNLRGCFRAVFCVYQMLHILWIPLVSSLLNGLRHGFIIRL